MVFKNYILFLFISFFAFQSCNKSSEKILLFKNGIFHTMSNDKEINGFLIVKNNKITYLGEDKTELKNIIFQKTIDLKKQHVYPGFIDAHCHFYGLGFTLLEADLMGSKSFEEVLARLKKHAFKNPKGWIKGRGWDQNLWTIKKFPTKEKLDLLFPNRPVFIKRVDGHAALVNSVALKMAKINSIYPISGGEIMGKNNQPNGILVDNAIDIVKNKIPVLTRKQNIAALKRAEKECFKHGLTSLTDAGLPLNIAMLIDSMQKVGELSINMNIMLEPNEKEIAYCKTEGIYKTDKLQIRSFKLYADGALGSRGAYLKKDYCDRKGHRGTMLTTNKDIEKISRICYENNYQLCTHSIGDSSSAIMLNMYAKYLKTTNDKRWRIEHAQVLDPADIDKFKRYSIIPSVQPTHATSDGEWAPKRLCKKRMEGAYAYKTLLEQLNYLPLGTDFPVEPVNPMRTLFSAVYRADLNDSLKKIYQINQALTKKEALMGMTIWAAKAQFQEHERGTIEVGKRADFTVFNINLMEEKIDKKTKPSAIILDGKLIENNQAPMAVH